MHYRRKSVVAAAAAALIVPFTMAATQPVDGGTVTSGYGPRGSGFHDGIDISAPLGTPIHSVESGTVIAAGQASGYGLWIRVAHDDGTVATYGHVHSISVSDGQRVSEGQVIGTVGSRGNSTGPHLHFEIATSRSTSADLDPQAYLADSPDPAPKPKPKPKPEPTPKPTPDPKPQPDSDPATYTVQAGDSLWAIAQDYDPTWRELARENDIQSPYTIYVGQELDVTTRNVYVVQSGDTLSEIGTDLGVSWQELAEINDLDNPNLIYPGNELVY